MLGKKFKIESALETGPNQFIVVDNGEFRIIANRGNFQKMCQSKGLNSEKMEEAWQAVLSFKDEVDSVDKTQMHIGSTCPDSAIGSALLDKGFNFSTEEVNQFIAESKK